MNHLIPHWFVEAGIIIEVFLALIALTTAFFAFRLCKGIPQRTVRSLGVAYGSLGIAYTLVAGYNLLTTGGNPYDPEVAVPLVILFAPVVTLAFIVLSLFGITLLLYLTLKQPSIQIFFLLFVGSIVAVFLSRDVLFSYILFSSFYLIFLAMYFIRNYLANKKPHTLMIALAFFLLVLSRIDFLFSWFNPLFYVFAHFFELISFSLILASVIYIRRKCRYEARSNPNPA